ncbi:hypothetical protein [Pseudogemmobacter humi]|uniref:Bleomycin resistance protein n=1 Tax=Pseudogemmobacter humi TaxID=2483812 RepID=A0A3P5XUD1_9RHOB|nr:hypothetical protein [Pseudogemmobacter humi]VDC31669.1 Bleomycin resistance protein [Pseudogemmobacter humi]
MAADRITATLPSHDFAAPPALSPRKSRFSAGIRLDDPDALLPEWPAAGPAENCHAIPRLTRFFRPEGGPGIFALADAEGLLLRVIENRDTG